jgi:hypothetical protein
MASNAQTEGGRAMIIGELKTLWGVINAAHPDFSAEKSPISMLESISGRVG